MRCAGDVVDDAKHVTVRIDVGGCSAGRNRRCDRDVHEDIVAGAEQAADLVRVVGGNAPALQRPGTFVSAQRGCCYLMCWRRIFIAPGDFGP
jgi:hypothetical protein